eukprot:CAMPEP_0168392328 /NCGR_PEP_ID=MMETSP0228-20121227/18441_1 /TAXON_ID=133427 /ORGANISM="Protoceratium reticulatum, Strain CCCM 535 (=CCMP 1889)" /LENGTH=45 /DNA_ID= /DNA_START= /DNA_END= /DNA_ORIENTATION=
MPAATVVTPRPSSAVLRGHVDAEVDQAVRVSPLVVVPGDELHEGV